MAVATKPAKKSGKAPKKYGYDDVFKVASRPLDQRREMPIGRGGTSIVPRKFHLNDDELKKLRDAHEAGDAVPNPQNRGSYFYIIEALKKLGRNRKHAFKAVVAQIRELMSDKETKDGDGKTGWQRFLHKGAETSPEDRILQNIEVLQRTNTETSTTPYGLKLLQVGQKVLKTKGIVIDLLKDGDGGVFVRLNTDAAEPTNELKRRRGASVDEAPARKPAKKVSKATTKDKEARAAKKVSKPKSAKPAKSEDAVAPAAGPESDAPTELAAAEPEAVPVG